jgi:hypothetical protein
LATLLMMAIAAFAASGVFMGDVLLSLLREGKGATPVTAPRLMRSLALSVVGFRRPQDDPAVDRHHVDLDVEAFAVFVLPGCADARPEALAFAVLGFPNVERYQRRALCFVSLVLVLHGLSP